MNLYLRYFDDEAVVADADAGYQFLCDVLGENLDIKHLEQLREYMDSPMNFTKRFKVRPRVYYVAIKTDADSLETFKWRGMQMAEERAGKTTVIDNKALRMSKFSEERPGWYEGHFTFKRVLFNIDTNKNEYVDTDFAARVKAHSVEDLYNRLCEHLHMRPDIDPRSQMPSIKGKNFQYIYLGTELPE